MKFAGGKKNTKIVARDKAGFGAPIKKPSTIGSKPIQSASTISTLVPLRKFKIVKGTSSKK